jgi:cobalt-zinc-cadmium efflux system protein
MNHRAHHHHHHDGGAGETARRPLLAALALTGGFCAVEAIVALFTGSLALLSDSVHMLIDSGALALALFAQVLAGRTRTGRRTFGFRRAEILAAMVNGALLGLSGVWILIEAIGRLRAPRWIGGGAMLLTAALGLSVNLVCALILARPKAANANVRAAAAHVMADAAASVAAIVAAVLILGFGWVIADPLASIGISLLILVGAWRLVRESVNVLMEGVPAGIDAREVEGIIRGTPGVGGFHDLHIWCVSDGFAVVTVHVVLLPGHHGTDVARSVVERIEGRLGIAHVTVQPEAPRAELVPRSALVRRREEGD